MVLEVADHKYDIGNYPRCAWFPGCDVPASSSGVFVLIKAKSIDTSYLGVFEVTDYEYDIGESLECTWCSGWHVFASSSGVSPKNEEIWVETFS